MLIVTTPTMLQYHSANQPLLLESGSLSSLEADPLLFLGLALSFSLFPLLFLLFVLPFAFFELFFFSTDESESPEPEVSSPLSLAGGDMSWLPTSYLGARRFRS